MFDSLFELLKAPGFSDWNCLVLPCGFQRCRQDHLKLTAFQVIRQPLHLSFRDEYHNFQQDSSLQTLLSLKQGLDFHSH